MKKTLSIFATSLMLSSAAIAGNLDPITIGIEPIAQADARWDGFYLGAQAGMASGITANYWDDEGPQVSEGELDGNIYGAFAGYNFQRGSLVFGAEAAYSMSDVGFLTLWGDGNDPEDFFGGTFINFIDLKARVGATAGNALIYGFAGWTGSQVQYYTENGDLGDPFSVSGMNYGVGVDYQVSERFFVGLEYIVRDLSANLERWGEDDAMEANIQAVQLRIGMNF